MKLTRLKLQLTICLSAIFLAVLLNSCDTAEGPESVMLHVYHLRCGTYDIEFHTAYKKMDASHETQPFAIINGQNIPMAQEVTVKGVRYDGEFDGAPITLRHRGDRWKLKINNERPSISCKYLE
jgi:hypothetical protein